MRHFTTTKAQGDLHLVAIVDELVHIAHLHVIIMIVDIRTHLDFLDVLRLLRLAREVRLFLRLVAMLADIQQGMFAQARDRRDAKITRDVETFAEVEEFYTADTRYPGWLEVQWSKPTGDALAQVEDRLKALKLTIRNVPRDAEPADGPCIFTGEKAVERILIARAY